MALLDLSLDELLTTTRAVRKRMDFDRPVDLATIRECLQIALQAPTGGNTQGWHFVVVTDQDKRNAIGEVYRKAFDLYRDMPQAAGNIHQDDPVRGAQQRRVMDSADYLAQNMERAHVHLIPCISGRPAPDSAAGSCGFWASLIPAAWSYMLAARARGLGTSLTTLHLIFEREVADILGIPYEDCSQGPLIPTAYTQGTEFKLAKREPLDSVLHINGW